MTFVSSSPVLVLAASDPYDRSRWDDIVDHAPISDVYYRSGYACASEAAGHGKAIGLLLATQRIRALMPLLVRPLSDLPFAAGEPGFDAATPYGYGGLLPLSYMERPAQADVRALLDAFQQWCRDAGIISCLIRLHPLLEQDRWLGQDHWPQQATLLRYRLPTVAVDLASWDSTGQRIAGLHRNRRAALNVARRCLRVSWSGSEVPLSEALALFQPIYEQRMACLNASSYYFFPSEYYASLAEGLSNNLAVALAWLHQKLVGAALFLVDRQFAHYHLTGSNEEGREHEADTMLVNAGAHWARERGCRFLHLGGGGDSNGLYRYKRGFGGDVYRYHTLDVIADESRYRDLVERRMRYESLPEVRQGFFPQYRA
jgi:Acetyltransferase (GNAT) domain